MVNICFCPAAKTEHMFFGRGENQRNKTKCVYVCSGIAWSSFSSLCIAPSRVAHAAHSRHGASAQLWDWHSRLCIGAASWWRCVLVCSGVRCVCVLFARTWGLSPAAWRRHHASRPVVWPREEAMLMLTIGKMKKIVYYTQKPTSVNAAMQRSSHRRQQGRSEGDP